MGSFQITANTATFGARHAVSLAPTSPDVALTALASLISLLSAPLLGLLLLRQART